MAKDSTALRYLKKECSSLVSGSLEQRVQALKIWAAHHQIRSRTNIYKRLAMAVALETVLGSSRNFIVALASKPVPLGNAMSAKSIRVIVEAVNGCTPSLDRAQQKLISRDVRAVRYLISNGTSPDEVCDLAKSSGEGVHAWAANYAIDQEGEEYDLDAENGLNSPSNQRLRKVEVTLKIGREKKRRGEGILSNDKIYLLEELIERLLEIPK